MSWRARTNAVTDLVLEVFRLNGRLLAAGDALVMPIGLTSARWQVLGAVALGGQPRTSAEVARAMGLARQSVLRVVNDLERDGIVWFVDNPRHKRAKCIALTKRGTQLFAVATRRQAPWARALSDGLDTAAINQASALLRVLRRRLETPGKLGEPS